MSRWRLAVSGMRIMLSQRLLYVLDSWSARVVLHASYCRACLVLPQSPTEWISGVLFVPTSNSGSADEYRTTTYYTGEACLGWMEYCSSFAEPRIGYRVLDLSRTRRELQSLSSLGSVPVFFLLYTAGAPPHAI